jgi:hypothetical protein
MATTCRHYYDQATTVHGIGMSSVEAPLPMYRLLEALDAAGTSDSKIKKLQMIDEMGKRGGGNIESAMCRFKGQPTCPYYEA